MLEYFGEYLFYLFLLFFIPIIGWVLGIIGYFRSSSLSRKVSLLNNKLKSFEDKMLADSYVTPSSIPETNSFQGLKTSIPDQLTNNSSSKQTTKELDFYEKINSIKEEEINKYDKIAEAKQVGSKSEAVKPISDTFKGMYNYEPTTTEKLMSWLSKDWLMKLGALMVFLAASWFFGLAYLNFSNEFKLMLVLMLSLATFIFGLFQYPKNKDVGQVLVALGSITAVTTFSFGYYGFELLSPIVVMIASIIVIGSTYYIAHIKKSLPLAVLSTVGFYVVPFLAITSEPNYVQLGLYVLFINIFILITTMYNKWEILITIATLFTGFILLNITTSNIDVIKTLISPIFIVVIANILVLYLFIIFYTSKKDNLTSLTIANSIIVTAYTSLVIPAFFYDDIASLSLVLTSIILMFAAIGLYLSNINRVFIYIQVCASLALLTIATINILQNQTFLPVIIGVEFLVYMVGLYYIFKDQMVLTVFNILQLFPALIVLLSTFVSPYWYYLVLSIFNCFGITSYI